MVLSFADNGKGVDSELLPHLFEPFYTTARNEQCTGLGLNVIYNAVVNNLKGQVEVFSPTMEQHGFTIQISISMDKVVKALDKKKRAS